MWGVYVRDAALPRDWVGSWLARRRVCAGRVCEGLEGAGHMICVAKDGAGKGGTGVMGALVTYSPDRRTD